MNSRGLAAVAIFALSYVVIIAGERSPRKLDRPAAGLVGALLMVLCGVLTQGEALAAIDFGTLVLLFGMMLVIHFARTCGLLDWLAHTLVARSHSARHLLWVVCLASGVLSALFVNDTICLLMTPLLLTVARKTRLPAEPYLLALATSSNAGSVMTLTGNPQNMLIGQSSGWGWGPFALRMIPVGLVCLALNAWVVGRIYWRELATADFSPSDVPHEPVQLQRRLTWKTVWVLIGLMVAFILGAPLGLAALTAGAALLILANRPPEEAYASVDWSLLLFFAGLFVVVDGITRTQGIWITRLMPLITHHVGSAPQLAGFALGSVVGSNLFSNVPFVMLLRGWMVHLPKAPLLWLNLAAASTLAGNLTLLGSVANLIVAQGARDECPLTFRAFLRVGVASTVLTVTASVAILWLYGKLGWY